MEDENETIVEAVTTAPTVEINKIVEEVKSAVEKGNSEKLVNLEKAFTDLQDEVKSVATAQARSSATDRVAEVVETKAAEFEAFRHFLVTGNAAEYKAAVLNTQTASDGGAVVPQNIQQSIMEIEQALTPARSYATVTSGSEPKLIQPVRVGDAAAAFVGELDERISTDSANFEQSEVEAFELYAYPEASLAFLEDGIAGIEAWMTRTVGESFAQEEQAKFVAGTGVKQPKGLLTYVGAGDHQGIEQTTAAAADAVTADELLKLQFSVPNSVRSTGSYLMNANTLFACMTLKNANGEYIFRPANDNASSGVIGTLWGRPVVEDPSMPDLATGNTAIVFGKLSDYQIYDRVGLTIVQDQVTKPGFKRFYVRKRTGGDLMLGGNLHALTMA